MFASSLASDIPVRVSERFVRNAWNSQLTRETVQRTIVSCNEINCNKTENEKQDKRGSGDLKSKTALD
jgi:hypothetical protein